MQLNALIAALGSAVILTAVSGSAAHAATPQTENTPNIVTVAPGDYLAKIAEEHGTVYTRLYDANEQIKDPDIIYAGDKVRIPAADENIPSRPLPAAVPVIAQEAPAAAAPQTPVTAVAPRQIESAPAPADSGIAGGVWDRLAACESGGRWNINTGNGFYGGLQFTLSSWQAVGGSGYPHLASKSEQIARAEILQSRQGWGAWPACSTKLGLR